MAEAGGIRALRLSGTPRERGRIHGESHRLLIAEGMGRWRAAISASIGVDPELYLDRFVEGTYFVQAIERWMPHLLDEVRGIGEGAGVSFRDVYAYQLMDEEWFFRHAFVREQDTRTADHCSTLGVFGEGDAPLLAQNMDLPKIYDGTQALLRIVHDDGVESLVFTPAGMIATTGLNSLGVAICCNTLAGLGGTGRGLPVAFIVRGVLERRTAEDAARFVQDVPHASGQNYMIGGPERIVDLECSPSTVVRCMPATTRLIHTNHPLANDDRPWPHEDGMGLVFGTPSSAAATPATAMSNSEQRLAFLARALAEGSERVTAETARSILSSCDVPISVARTSGGEGMTLGSLVMQLSVPPVLDLAPGPPAETRYDRWTFAHGSEAPS